jgi:hypothetical protein
MESVALETYSADPDLKCISAMIPVTNYNISLSPF